MELNDIVPLDDEYSFDYDENNEKNGINISKNDTNDTICDTISVEDKLLTLIEKNGERTQKEYALQMNVSLPTVKRLLARLQQENIVVREGNNRKGKWVIQKRSDN